MFGWRQLIWQVSDPLFTLDDVRRGLETLADYLTQKHHVVDIRIVGGAAVMIRVGRDVLTRDIDALFSSSPVIDEGIRRIAVENFWPDTWLNDAVKMFASHFDQTNDSEVWLSRTGVTVSVASPHLLLAMKLLAARPRDADDIARLIEVCGAVSRDAALSIFDAYYPTESLQPRALRILDDLFSST